MAQDTLRPLELATSVPSTRPTKLSAILSGFNECYAMLLALMQMTNTPEATINFDRNHDDQVRRDSSYFCSTGTIDDVQKYFEAHWMHIPYAGRDLRYAVELWDQVIRPTLALAYRHRTGGYEEPEYVSFADFFADVVSSFNQMQWTTYTEVYMCQDEIAETILKAADFIQVTLETYCRQHYAMSLRLQDVNDAIAGPHPDKAMTLVYPYFRINMLHTILTSTDPNLRWAIFCPNDAEENIKVALLKTIPNRSINFKSLTKLFEQDKRCGWYDTEIGVFVVKQRENVTDIIRELNKRFDG